MELSKQLTKYDVYVIDDDVVASGNTFPFRDINQVVDAVFAELFNLADRIHSRKIVLGGWSYGGLVAFLTALRFQDLCLKTETLNIEILSVILIDSPLSLDTDRKKDDLEFIVPDNLSEFVAERSRAHFADCTTLIVSYHKERSLRHQDSDQLLHVPIIEFRPLTTFSSSSKEDHGTFRRSITHDIHYTPGNHWTMIFGEHAAFISDILNKNDPASLQQQNSNF
jgi:pimeloyl-ACP methyl ester carboxylesterase